MPAMNAVDSPSLPNSHSNRWSSELFASTTLSSVHIAQAIQRSSDNGATLMFSKLNLSDVGASAAEELASIGRERPDDESPLRRITLGNNRLTALPLEFASLSQLRYLNLKRNNFTVFPDVLTRMPSLDTLDISHNRIQRLPVEAGRLVHLRVENLTVLLPRVINFCPQFSNLEVLEVERNPIEWPPKVVMEKADSLDSRNVMKDWIRSLQHWIEADYRAQIHDDSGSGEQKEVEIDMEEKYNSWKFPLMENISFTPHNRSFSVDSSVSSTSDSNQEPEIANPLHGEVDHPPPLPLGILGTFSTEDSPTRALESYLPSPADTEFFDGNPIPTSLEHHPHARNASYSTGSHPLTYPNLIEKKSMPDLRIMKLVLNSNKNTGLVDVAPTGLYPKKRIKNPPSKLQWLLNVTLIFTDSLPFPPLQYFRNLYYVLSNLLEAFSLQYDRISSVLRKVLDPASTDMTQLINSLERFDITSRKSLPSPMVCRAVGVLALQLQVIVTGDDVRYSRWILLELYGATAELASAWETVVPHIEAIRPFLHSKPFVGQPSPLVLNSPGGDVYSAPPASAMPLSSDSFLASLRIQAGVPRVKEGVRTARRHAGSFSSKDVEIGKKLPSYDDVPGVFGGVVSGTARSTPIPRAPKRQATVPLHNTLSSSSPTNSALSSVSLPSISSALGDSPRDMHSRQSSQASFQTFASSSALVPIKANYLDLPSNSKSQVDKEALQAVQAAVGIAPSVWDMIENLFDGDLNTISPVHHTLEKARVVTARLTQTLQAMQMYDSDVSSDRRDFSEDAHTFLKIVVQLSNIIKTYKGPISVSSALRTGMVKLTNSTEEFAILLHVSSFTPSTPRPYTPLITNPAGPEDLRLDSSLSRSKSTHHFGSFKLPGNTHDGPRSALPSQMVKLPVMRQPRSREGRDSPMADPG
ncbi:hypothetical protein C0995_002728 [Termitomyces sp. Mi166|nr:hypothetical protein C0995_002728 [Termitomyces sp. Mi166\